MELLDINTNDTDITNYRNDFLRGNKKIVTKEFLKSGNVPGIGLITISSEDYINESKNITYHFWKNDIFNLLLCDIF